MNHTIIMSKYQGLGNDYLILDPKKNKVELQGKKVALLCQRGFGLGADGVLYGPVEMEGKLGVRIYNADGSESAISGNGVRIFAKYLMDQGYVTEKKFDIKNLDFIDDRNEYNPVQTDTTDSNYLFDNEDAIVVDFKKRKK